MNYWVSWYHEEGMGEFELHSPWWVSGYRTIDKAATICAAVKAADAPSARVIVRSAYDKVAFPEFRFVTHKADDWHPFSDRFPKADWMKWG